MEFVDFKKQNEEIRDDLAALDKTVAGASPFNLAFSETFVRSAGPQNAPAPQDRRRLPQTQRSVLEDRDITALLEELEAGEGEDEGQESDSDAEAAAVGDDAGSELSGAEVKEQEGADDGLGGEGLAQSPQSRPATPAQQRPPSSRPASARASPSGRAHPPTAQRSTTSRSRSRPATAASRGSQPPSRPGSVGSAKYMRRPESMRMREHRPGGQEPLRIALTRSRAGARPSSRASRGGGGGGGGGGSESSRPSSQRSAPPAFLGVAGAVLSGEDAYSTGHNGRNGHHGSGGGGVGQRPRSSSERLRPLSPDVGARRSSWAAPESGDSTVGRLMQARQAEDEHRQAAQREASSRRGNRRSHISVSEEELEEARRTRASHGSAASGAESMHMRDHVRSLISAGSGAASPWRSTNSEAFSTNEEYEVERRGRETAYCTRRDAFREYLEEKMKFKHLFDQLGN